MGGAARLLPALVEILEKKAPACNRCRLRLNLSLSDQTSPGKNSVVRNARPARRPRTETSCSVDSSGVADEACCWSPQRRRSLMMQPSTPEPQEPHSPTFQNLAKDPELYARVMRNAIPLDSPAGRVLSGKDRRSDHPLTGQALRK